MVLGRFSTLWPDVLWIWSCHVFPKWWLDMYWKRYWDVFPNGIKTFSENGIQMFFHMIVRCSLKMVLRRFLTLWPDVFWKWSWDVFPICDQTFFEYDLGTFSKMVIRQFENDIGTFFQMVTGTLTFFEYDLGTFVHLISRRSVVLLFCKCSQKMTEHGA